MYRQILVNHRHVVQTHNANKSVIALLAHVCLLILEFRLTAGLSVSVTPNAQVQELALTKNVVTLVLDHAAVMRNVA